MARQVSKAKPRRETAVATKTRVAATTTAQATKSPTVQNGTRNSNKRRAETNKSVPPKPTKRQRLINNVPINPPPSQKLDVYVFGSGDQGELGLGSKGAGITDVEYPKLNNLLDASTVGVVQIAVGGMHCVALTHDQKILTWGVNDNWALGRDTSWEAPTRDADADSSEDSEAGEINPKESTPTAIPADFFDDDIKGIAQVAATDNASFILTVDGLVYGWGTFCGNDGIFGFFKEDAMEDHRIQKRPALIPELKNIKFLATGANHVQALDHKGNVFAWGSGEQGQLGRRIVQRRQFNSLVPSSIGLPKNKTTYTSCGLYHGFAIDVKGRVWAWGLNNFGQAGLTSSEDDSSSTRATIVPNLQPYKIKEIQGGNHHSVACTEDGKLLAWGRCDDSQAGVVLENLPQADLIFDSRDRPRILTKPTIVPVIHASFVAAGIDNSFAITPADTAYSWGYSDGYRTGLGTDDAVKEPTLMDSEAVKSKRLTFAGCGGQFGVTAGPAASRK